MLLLLIIIHLRDFCTVESMSIICSVFSYSTFFLFFFFLRLTRDRKLWYDRDIIDYNLGDILVSSVCMDRSCTCFRFSKLICMSVLESGKNKTILMNTSYIIYFGTIDCENRFSIIFVNDYINRFSRSDFSLFGDTVNSNKSSCERRRKRLEQGQNKCSSWRISLTIKRSEVLHHSIQ